MRARRRPVEDLEQETRRTMAELRGSFADLLVAANAHQAAADAFLAAIEERERDE